MRRAVLAALALALLGAALWKGPAWSREREARARLRVLDEILLSRNDNDPRLDTAFDGLSPEARRLFRSRYLEVPPERRNERGTIVYLLGRNLRSQEDWEFLRAVAGEPPCLSLSDCSKPPRGGSAEGDAVTLAYPSLVALRQARRALEDAPGDPSTARNVSRVIEAVKRSGVPAVVRAASAELRGSGGKRRPPRRP